MPAHKDNLMTVGELARRVGVTVRTIQYYDQKGLLHPSSKSEQNQRLYSTDDEERLYRILTLKFLGFSLTQIKEAEGIDDCQKLSGALDHRMCELERESMEILRNINTISNLKEHLAASESVRWSDFAQAISDMQNREDVLWMAINGEGCDESSVPELTHEVINRWHELMGDTIEAMHDGVQPRDERGRELAARFERLGGMPSALTGLKRLANQRVQGPKKYGRDFYAGIQRRTLSFLKDALEALHEQALHATHSYLQKHKLFLSMKNQAPNRAPDQITALIGMPRRSPAFSRAALDHDVASPVNILTRFRERKDDDRFMDDDQQVQPQVRALLSGRSGLRQPRANNGRGQGDDRADRARRLQNHDFQRR